MKEIKTEEIDVVLRVYPFIAAAYQFGSTIRGQAGPLSDLDIVIVVDEEHAPSPVDLLRLELLLAHELQRHLNVREVDLITLNHQRLFLQHTVLRTGRLIYEASPKYRIRFMQKVIQAYLDFQPTLQFMERFHTLGRLRRCGIRFSQSRFSLAPPSDSYPGPRGSWGLHHRLPGIAHPKQ